MMFSEILKKYDDLIRKITDIKAAEAIDLFCTINSDRIALLEEMSLQNTKDAEKRAQELVREFVAFGDEQNFFDKISTIRSQTHKEYDERFTNSCRHWTGILDTKEEQFLLLLKERLAQKQTFFGKINEQNLEWYVIGIDPTNDNIQLMLRNPVASGAFKERGYTDVEDEDTFGCAELACSWSQSDVYRYLNTVFYEQAFSTAEKGVIRQAKRHINKEDFLIPNDISENHVYLLDLSEFLMLAPEMKSCDASDDYDFWWLSEQKARGWDDTGELPKIYAVKCLTGNLCDAAANKIGLIRPVVTVSLGEIVNIIEK